MENSRRPEERKRVLSRAVSVCLGMAVVVTQTTTLITASNILETPGAGFDSPLYLSVGMPLISALVSIPTSVCVILFNALLPRDIDPSEASLSLGLTALPSIVVFLASPFAPLVPALGAEAALWVVVGIGIVQGVLVAPLQSFAYALTNTSEFSGGLLYTILGSLIIGCAQSLLAMVSKASCISISFGVACAVFVLTRLAMTAAEKKFSRVGVECVEVAREPSPAPEMETGPHREEIHVVIYRPTTTPIEPSSRGESALRITMRILRDGWPSLATMMLLQAGSWAVYPALFRNMEPSSMDAALFATLIVFVVPNGGAFVGTLVALHNFNLGRWVEMVVGAARFLGILVLAAVCNYRPDRRVWSEALLTNDYACLGLFAAFFVVGGACLIESYRTLALSVEARHAPRAATIGSVFCVFGNALGLAIAMAFPYAI